MSLSKQIYKVLFTPLVLTAVGAVICALLIYNSQNQMQKSTDIFMQKKQYLEQLYTNLGYGGGIHSFKNYIIRRDLQYKLTAEEKLNEALRASGNYKALPNVSRVELAQITDIELVINQYLEKISLLNSDQLASLSVVDLDAQVKVNDEPAISAIARLDNLLDAQNRQVGETLEDSTFRIISFIFVVLALTVLLSWVVAQRHVTKMLLSVKSVTRLSRKIADGKMDFSVVDNSDYGNGEMNKLAGDLSKMGKKHRDLLNETQQKSALDNLLQHMSMAFTGQNSKQDVYNAIINKLAEYMSAASICLYIADGKYLPLVAQWGLTSLDADKPVPHRDFLKQLLNNREVTTIDQVPEKFWRLKSMMGSMVPTKLLYLPLVFESEQLGIVEIALSDNGEFTNNVVADKYCQVISQGLYSLHMREENQGLLQASQKQTAELELQQEELRVSNEELQKQSRELEIKTVSLDSSNSELSQAKTDLEAKAAELIKINNYKSEFLANMSHEFRTPLNSLMVLSSLLLEKETSLSGKNLEYLKSIHQSGNDLLMLIEDILDLTKIEARKITLNIETFSLRDFIDELDVSFNPLFKQTKVDWTIRIEDSIQINKLTTDRSRLKQILRNLISNALKFTSEGKVELSLHQRSADTISLSVSDTGVGIDASKQQRIFEAFEQEDSSVDRAYGGTGLGLSISKELASLLEGGITLESEKGKGSKFELTIATELDTPEAIKLPAALNMAEKGIQQKAQTLSSEFIKQDDNADELIDLKKQVEELDANKLSLLIVEDDKAFAMAVGAAAKRLNMQAVCVASGELAMALLESFTPDAVLLDIKLPNLSGMAILESLKSNVKTRHIPVHMISGMDYQNNALRLGAMGYLTKPMTIDKVSAALERVKRIITTPHRRLLLIEDNAGQQQAISALLGSKTTEVMVCGYGEDAIAALKSSNYDAIVLDLSLPDTTGLAFLETIKQMDISLPPVVIYTAKELDPEEENTLSGLAESIILKGARSPEKLLEQINLFLHRDEAELSIVQRKVLEKNTLADSELSGYKIMLVDDDMRNIFALTSALEQRGADVVIAKDGVEAMNLLASESHLDLVLTDIMMPNMNGYELIKAIRDGKVKKYARVPIVALTAKAGKEDHDQIIECGANDYLAKPLNLTSLMSVLRVWLPEQGLMV
ncbi:response regulator [Alteromonas confluentis]|uniref:histidine kinase n=1 Tax=Alteromonas confluentis TaxID=1656094 RepID=A0A1E7ZFJ8_9ALTE|nr:response regulator [Alteromonas confluentis]OFC72250.1 hypothetical protein BFC18_04080 [Alteromonas confluentis]